MHPNLLVFNAENFTVSHCLSASCPKASLHKICSRLGIWTLPRFRPKLDFTLKYRQNGQNLTEYNKMELAL